MGVHEVERYLTFLAVRKKVSASTQNQALSAILFLYKEVLKIELGWVQDVKRAKKTTAILGESILNVIMVHFSKVLQVCLVKN